MKRKEFSSSRENVSRIIVKHGCRGKPNAQEKKALRDYLAGCASSNKHSSDVLYLMVQIRELFGFGLPQELAPLPSKSKEDFEGIRERLLEINRLLFRADMNDPVNIALSDEADELLRALSREQSEAVYTIAMAEHVRLEAEYNRADKRPGNGAALVPHVRKPIMIWDPEHVRGELGREPTESEREAMAFRMDAVACGRSDAATVAACEVFGRGRVSDEVKIILGLMS